MKKTTILIAITVALGIQNPAMAIITPGVTDLSKPGGSFWDTWDLFKHGISRNKISGLGTNKNKAPSEKKRELPQEEKTPPPISSFLDILNKQLDTTKKQLNETIKIHQSITGSRRDNIPRTNIGINYYFQNPKFIYGKSGFKESSFSENNITSKTTTMGDIIMSQDLSHLSVPEARQFIEKRSQYAAIVDKAVSLQVFGETESRFKKIENVFHMIEGPLDLKAVVELQSYMEGTLSIFENEAIKLQMVAHLRNAEQALIHQQKYKRNIKILHHQNKGMPQVKYVSAIQ
ncbi:type IV secretion system protein [Bartonella sp. AD13SXNS]|uniref:type IV secretion system protein n=1 Tax=Bartonella sp. AD13SXNS TaxID=3243462 RepID=UPI0035D0D448